MFVAMLSSLIVLPVLLYDLTKHTNKFAGPVYRLQKAMQDVAAGKSIAPIEYRDGDYWTGLAEAFNGMLARLEAAQSHPQDDEAIEFDTVGAGSGL
jgi:nitrogen fixation/metabolism regulation signal transduction histidine kinase